MTRVVYPNAKGSPAGSKSKAISERDDVPPADIPLAPVASTPVDDHAPASDRPLEPSASEPPASPPAEGEGRSPEERAERTAAHWNRGTDEILACAAEVSAAWEALRNDPAGMRAYVDGLVKKGMLTEREAADPQGSAKLSSLRKMAEHRAILRDPRVSARVGPGYSKLTLCARIAEEHPGNEDEKLRGLVGILESCPNEEVDRQFLVAANKQLKRERDAATAQKETPADKQEEEPAAADGATTWPQLLDEKQRFDRVLITLRPLDKRLLARSLAHPEKIEEQLPLRNVLTKNAVVLIATEVSDIPLFAEHPAFRCGIKGPPRVFLARRPPTPDISKAPILIALERGDVEPAANVDLWVEGADANPAAVAAELYPGGHWLHLFADKEREGSTTLVGDHGWLDMSELSK